MPSFTTRRYPFFIVITTLVMIIVLTLTSLFLWISYRESKAAAIHMADRLFSEINEKTKERYENSLESVAVLAGTVVHMPGMSATPEGDGMRHPAVDLMFEALAFYDYLFSTYLAYDDGSLIQIIAIRKEPKLLSLFNAPAETIYVLRTISTDSKGSLKQHWRFLDKQLHFIGAKDDLNPDYDPRTSHWYIWAQSEETSFFTQPYIIRTAKLPGITCAKKLVTGGGVFGADITLDRFSTSLKRQQISDNGLLFLFDHNGRIIAHPKENPITTNTDGKLQFLTGESSGDPLTRSIITRYQRDPVGMLNHTNEIEILGSAYLVRLTALKTELKFDQILASIAPVSDFTAHIRQMQHRIFLFSGLILLIMLPFALLMSRKISQSLNQLEQESRKIQHSDFSTSEPFDSNIKEIHSLIQTFILMKATILRLLEEQRALFDAFIQLLAGAIDAKSPYTGGHCARVPKIATLLAKAAHDSTDEPFADFMMETENQWREFNVAAWLHDCGKVTTPEYIVDKATKLETIHNRIHEIRMRFEVLLRDAEIDNYRKLLAGDIDEATLAAELKMAKEQITNDFAFVAQCNIGGEFMADDKIERIEHIASRTWIRHLDDHIGISQDEATLKNRQSQTKLPVKEHVLADKPEHIIPRANPDPFDGNPFGFKMTVPKDQYNLGEIYNLSIRKGTLSPEDRFKINEHITQTITMLKKLPFPEYLKNVTEFAGAHHETMIGTGYPRGLKKEHISIPARIMAIADIFEALTASDRPYKLPKTLNNALRIMSFMRDDQHIDPELFDLFLKKRVYQTYAEQFLDPTQFDAVDIHQYLSKPDATMHGNAVDKEQ